jgi:hypothetical protein
MKLITLGIIFAMVLTPTMALFATDVGFLRNNINEQSSITNDGKSPISTLDAVPNIVFWPENIYSRPHAYIKWFGEDDLMGVGIQNFDVQYKMQYIGDGYHTMELAEWQDWLMETENTSASLLLELDYAYYFRCRARDYMNNTESWPVTWDAITIAKGVAPDTYEEVVEILREKKDEREDDDEERRKPRPEPRDEIPPESRVKRLFPFHFLISPLCWPADDELMSVMVYPYPPSYHIIGWLEDHGIISQVYDYGTIPVSWFGEDNPGGSGIESYDVQYRHPQPILTFKETPFPYSMDWNNILTETEETETKFKVYGTGYYQFRCRARDTAGNEEDYPVSADTSVLVIDLRFDWC